MELEALVLADDERQLVEIYRSMAEADKKLCMILAARLSSQASTSKPQIVINNSQQSSVFLYCGDNTNNHSPINVKP